MALEFTSQNGEIDDPRDLKGLGNLFVIYKKFFNITTLYSLTGQSGYQAWDNAFVTPLPSIDNNSYWDFAMSMSFDLAAIKKNTELYPTGSGFTELHILTQKSQYTELFHIVTGLKNSDGNFTFQFAPNNDLFIIQRNGFRSTEVHVLSFASNFQDFITHTETALGITDDTWDFVIDSDRNLVIIQKGSPTDPTRRTGTGSTEIHILSADSNYQTFIFDMGTPLEMTGHNFKFCMSLDQYLEIDLPE